MKTNDLCPFCGMSIELGDTVVVGGEVVTGTRVLIHTDCVRDGGTARAERG